MSQQPVPGTRSAVRNMERAAPGSPIWPCTRWGFPCLRACAWSGGLLPHPFTLTQLRSFERCQAVYFLWHFPSARLSTWPPRVYPRQNQGYAASRPMEFGLSSPVPRSGTEAILRPSKITGNILDPSETATSGPERRLSSPQRFPNGDRIRLPPEPRPF